MNRITRRILHLVVWGCAFFVFAAAAWVGFCWLKRPPYLVPDTSAFATGDVFFSVGDAWESVAVRALSGYTSFEVCDSTRHIAASSYAMPTVCVWRMRLRWLRRW